MRTTYLVLICGYFLGLILDNCCATDCTLDIRLPCNIISSNQGCADLTLSPRPTTWPSAVRLLSVTPVSHATLAAPNVSWSLPDNFTTVEGFAVRVYFWNADGNHANLHSCHVFNLTKAKWLEEDRHKITYSHVVAEPGQYRIEVESWPAPDSTNYRGSMLYTYVNVHNQTYGDETSRWAPEMIVLHPHPCEGEGDDAGTIDVTFTTLPKYFSHYLVEMHDAEASSGLIQPQKEISDSILPFETVTFTEISLRKYDLLAVYLKAQHDDECKLKTKVENACSTSGQILSTCPCKPSKTYSFEWNGNACNLPRYPELTKPPTKVEPVRIALGVIVALAFVVAIFVVVGFLIHLTKWKPFEKKRKVLLIHMYGERLGFSNNEILPYHTTHVDSLASFLQTYNCEVTKKSIFSKFDYTLNMYDNILLLNCEELDHYMETSRRIRGDEDCPPTLLLRDINNQGKHFHKTVIIVSFPYMNGIRELEKEIQTKLYENICMKDEEDVAKLINSIQNGNYFKADAVVRELGEDLEIFKESIARAVQLNTKSVDTGIGDSVSTYKRQHDAGSEMRSHSIQRGISACHRQPGAMFDMKSDSIQHQIDDFNNDYDQSSTIFTDILSTGTEHDV